MAKMLLIKTDYTCRFVDVDTDEEGNIPLEVMQKAVQGYIEHLTCENRDDLDMFFNEEGKLIGLQCNEVATRLTGIHAWGDFIVGDAIVLSHDNNGNSRGLRESQIKTLTKRINAITGARIIG